MTGDPCPSGFRLPNDQELGALSLDEINNTLDLSMNGYLDPNDGSLSYQGTYGGYWSSSGSILYFNSVDVYVDGTGPASGFSVRCLQD